MCVGLLVPAIIGGMVFASLRQQKMAREADSRIVDKMGLLTSSLVDPVWNVDTKMIETIAAAALLDPQVVRITNRDQGVMPTLNIERSERRLGESRVHSSALVRRGTTLGSVELEIDNGLQQREIESDRHAYLVVLLGQVVLALVLILIAIRARVLKPLSRLTAFSDQLAGGNLDLPLNWKQTDEIGRLAQQMDQMRRGLQTSFAEQRSILNNVEVGVLFVRNRVVRLANRYAEQMFGYPSGAMEGVHIREIYLSAQHHADTARQIYEAIASSTGRYEGEQPLKRLDGTVFLARMRGCALEPAQPLEGSIWVFEDITEKRQAEEALSYSNSLTNAVLESTVDGILVVDREGKISRWNQKFVDLWRVPQALLNTEVKDPVLDHVKAQVTQPEVFLEKVRELYDHPDVSSEDTLQLLDGRVFERYSQPQRIGDAIVGRFWSFRDITGRKQSEQKLLLAASVFSHAREGIMITAADGTIMDVNDTFSRITGYDRKEALGRRPTCSSPVCTSQVSTPPYGMI
jgi:PAS domain S-box-containing protein